MIIKLIKNLFKIEKIEAEPKKSIHDELSETLSETKRLRDEQREKMTIHEKLDETLAESKRLKGK